MFSANPRFFSPFSALRDSTEIASQLEITGESLRKALAQSHNQAKAKIPSGPLLLLP